MTAAARLRAALQQPWRHGEALDCRGLVLTDRLDLAGLALCGVDFTGARFEAGIAAAGARFDGLSWFGGATFGDRADFSGTRFANDARFDGAGFGEAGFRGAEFRGTASAPQRWTTMPSGSADHARADSAPIATCRNPFSMRRSSMRDRTRS